jgi:hypothetical protein
VTSKLDPTFRPAETLLFTFALIRPLTDETAVAEVGSKASGTAKSMMRVIDWALELPAASGIAATVA